MGESGVCQMRDNVIAGEFRTRGGNAAGCQEFFDRKVGKLNDPKPIYINDGDETGARRKYRFFGIA